MKAREKLVKVSGQTDNLHAIPASSLMLLQLPARQAHSGQKANKRAGKKAYPDDVVSRIHKVLR